MVTRFLPGYFQPTRSYYKLHITVSEKWSFSEEVPAGPATCFYSDRQFLVAHLDGNLYYCKIDANVEIEKSVSYLEKGEIYTVESK
jgi:hypothetical protein